MKTNKISVEQALNLVKENKFNSDYEINFANSKIDAFDAVLLGKNGIDVPEELIIYDDDKIDYSDIPPITDEDIENGKIKWIHKAEVPIRKEVEDWIHKERIDINILLADLVENFYNTVKNISKNAAL
jgi:hypothetical protein